MGKYTNQDLDNYVARIKLTNEEKANYSSQIDNLKKKVEVAINDLEETSVLRVRRAGSWRKGTALKPKGDYPLDIDMVFFLLVEDEKNFDGEKLRQEIIKVLLKAYPQKKSEDFTEGNKTVGVSFQTSGLEVDIVPFIQKRKDSVYGKLARKKLNSGEYVETSVDKQLDFSKSMQESNCLFKSVVRILKSWRNYQELELSSFAIELIVAYLIKENKCTEPSSINELLITFFEFLGNSDVKVEIYFPGAIGDRAETYPWVADPTNNTNNILSQMGDGEWDETREKAENAFERLSHAAVIENKQETLEKWQEILGPSFNIQEV